MNNHFNRALVLGLAGLLPLGGCRSAGVSSGFPLVNPSVLDAKAPAPQELPPDKSAELFLATAKELEKAGREADAAAQYERARKFQPDLPGVSWRLAILYDRLGDDVRAATEYKLALKAAPRDSRLLSDYGYFHYQRGDNAEAEKWLRQAVSADAKNSRAWNNLGMALARQARERESYEAFCHTVTPPQAHANLGMLLSQQGQPDLARMHLREALAGEPDLQRARQALARLSDGPPRETPTKPEPTIVQTSAPCPAVPSEIPPRVAAPRLLPPVPTQPPAQGPAPVRQGKDAPAVPPKAETGTVQILDVKAVPDTAPAPRKTVSDPAPLARWPSPAADREGRDDGKPR